MTGSGPRASFHAAITPEQPLELLFGDSVPPVGGLRGRCRWTNSGLRGAGADEARRCTFVRARRALPLPAGVGCIARETGPGFARPKPPHPSYDNPLYLQDFRRRLGHPFLSPSVTSMEYDHAFDAGKEGARAGVNGQDFMGTLFWVERSIGNTKDGWRGKGQSTGRNDGIGPRPAPKGGYKGYRVWILTWEGHCFLRSVSLVIHGWIVNLCR